MNEKNFAGKNAYDVLGVSETSSFDEIKASFRKLAKLTHPDLSSSTDSNTSDQFIQILAAYEILSDSGRRSHYDSYLFSQRKILQKRPTHGSSMYIYNSHVALSNRMEVVEWLRWYRVAINDIVSHKQVVSGSGYFDVLQRDFYSAIHAAYYGPVIESMDSLPDCFEAEERSTDAIPEVLHLVSGRDLFGILRIVNNHPQLSHASHETLTSFTSVGSGLSQSVKNISISMNTESLDNAEIPEVQVRHHLDGSSDAYRDLELHISGRVVAMASRVHPKSCSNGIQNEDAEDHIHVFLSSNECPVYASKDLYGSSFSSGSFGSRILLGTITGLGTNPEEASCFVYDNSGTKTHVLLKHRTLLVKHLHWFQVGDEVSVCECRCSRARLPPSKFWLFEPRCAMHDIGGWYVETYGRNKKGKTVPSQRHWDGFVDHEKRLHPAVYLLGLAYRTLDLEDARKRKWRVKDIVEPRLFSFLHWFKRYV
ncbi:Chaperone dnaj-domain superfamily protein [Thalictrum thalictroides]|uniref:Chaperone dnaj-domain superfamily protein n=1 Tax=Thalictrum thalictroides TaxID=46969 RepID=A0A7J6WKI5_THATH|nr:Chaperone dnaj-domain superfamily protein [Thalictrum thalictroides]